MKMQKIALALVIFFGFLSSARPLFLYNFPLSWDVWYHVRIADEFASGNFFWDHGTFAPEGRPHTYPPLFHILLALLSKISGLSKVTMARLLPPFLFSTSLACFFLFARRISDEKTALIAVLLSSTTPIILDKGLAPLPETLSFPFLFLGLMFFYEKKLLSVLFFLLVFLTHGLTFISCVAAILLFSLGVFFLRRDITYIKLASKIFVLLFLISSPYLFLMYLSKSSIPYGGRHLLSFYPTKLGWVNLTLSCISLPFLRKEEGHLFVFSWFAANFILSFNPFLLPARFLEYMAWPLVLLAAIAIKRILPEEKKKIVSFVCFIALLGFFQTHIYTEKYKPELDSSQYLSFVWLRRNSISGNVFSSWQASPLVAALSRKPVFWGGYELTAPNLSQRNKDSLAITTTWNRGLLEKYKMSYIFLEEKQKDIPFAKIYCSSSSIFFIPSNSHIEVKINKY